MLAGEIHGRPYRVEVGDDTARAMVRVENSLGTLVLELDPERENEAVELAPGSAGAAMEKVYARAGLARKAVAPHVFVLAWEKAGESLSEQVRLVEGLPKSEIERLAWLMKEAQAKRFEAMPTKLELEFPARFAHDNNALGILLSTLCGLAPHFELGGKLVEERPHVMIRGAVVRPGAGFVRCRHCQGRYSPSQHESCPHCGASN